MTRRPVTLLLLLALFAGCVTEGATHPEAAGTGEMDAESAPEPDWAAVIVQGHDHADPSLHASAFGLELAGYTAMDGEPSGPAIPGGYQELAMAGAWAFVSNFGPDRGFSIVDVSDPSAPRHVSDFFPSRALGLVDTGGGSYWDVSVFAEADLVILSGQAHAQPLHGVGGGLFLVNVEDKEQPVLESYTPVLEPGTLIPVGIHNANPFEVNGTRYVAATTANGWTHLYAVEGQAPARTLRHLAVVDGMHDSAVQKHPLTGEHLLYTASSGVFIWNVDDPSAPYQVGFVGDDGTGRYYHETIPGNVLVEGRHYTVATTESMGLPTPFTLLDTTDPADPRVVGEWRLPVTITEPTTPYQYSGHNVDFDRGRLYIGHQHAGVWILDVSTPALAAEPKPLAYYLPHEPGLRVPRTIELAPSPMVWRATYHDDGLVYAVDTNSGLYALRATIPPSPLENATIHPHNIR